MREPDVWRLLDLEFDNPFANLALEEAIPTLVGKNHVDTTIRFWRNRNAAVIGCFPSAALEVNLDACKQFGTAVVRRFTGGGAVYHDHGNLNYSISLGKDHRLVTKDIGEIFKSLLMGVSKGFERFGLTAEYAPINSLQINGKKVCGAAGSVKDSFVFSHGSVLVDSDLHKLSRVLNPGKKLCKKACVRSVRKIVSNLSVELGRNLSIGEVKEALVNGFEETFQIRLVKSVLTKEEKRLGDKLLAEKYSTAAWNSRI